MIHIKGTIDGIKDNILSLETRVDYIEKGIEKTENALNKRLEAMNEFRAALKDQNNTFITRIEFESKHLIIEEKIETIQKLVYIGIGVLFVVEIVLKLIVK